MSIRTPLFLAVLLAGCAASGSQRAYPSLSPRAVEQGGFEEPASRALPTPRPEPELDARIAAVATADAARAEVFDRARTRAEAMVGAGERSPAGSDAWLDAQVALGDLDVLRAEASEAATTLEEIATDRAIAGDPPYPALDAAVAAARARVDAIDAANRTLTARLKR